MTSQGWVSNRRGITKNVKGDSLDKWPAEINVS